MLAHGLNGHPDQLDDLIDAWARAGFVVAAPRFPRTNVNDQGKAVLADAAEYPGDLSFVITQVLAMSTSATRRARSRTASTRRRIGAAGISLGGMAVYGLVSNSCCLDRRVDAAILMSAVRPDFPTGKYVSQKIPVMLIHGDADTGYRYSERTYPMLAAPKWFVTLRGGRHGPPFEDAPDEFDDFVRATTTAFWDRYLHDDRRGGRSDRARGRREPAGNARPLQTRRPERRRSPASERPRAGYPGSQRASELRAVRMVPPSMAMSSR